MKQIISGLITVVKKNFRSAKTVVFFTLGLLGFLTISPAYGGLLDPSGLLVGDYHNRIIYRYDFSGNLDGSITTSVYGIKGIAVINDKLYVSSSDRVVYEIDPLTGQTVSQFNTPYGWGPIECLGDNGSNLLIADRNTPSVLHELTTDGTLVNSIPLNHSGYFNPNGVDSDGDHTFVADNAYANPRLIEFDEYGDVVHETMLSDHAYSLGYDSASDSLFLGLRGSINTVANYDRSGNILSSFEIDFVPGGLEVLSAPAAVPVPSAMLLLAAGLAGLAGMSRKKRGNI